MGQRRTRDAWSKLYVFPGGRVDRGDSRVVPARPLTATVERRLAQGCSPARARALAVAAIRETWEETGLRIAAPTASVPSRVPEDWRGFLDRGEAPDLGGLHLLCRAITPPKRPKRFNARFFIVDAARAQGTLSGNGELHDLHWIDLEATDRLETPVITRVVLQELRELLAKYGRATTARRTPLFKTVHGEHRRLLE